MVLLHVLWRLQSVLPLRICAVHVHHGLQAASDDWAVFCQHVCAQWQIPLRIEKVRLDNKGLGLEGAARQARYAVFSGSPAQAVVLAHHADDQVETFMLAALRGGGVRALAAMPARRALNEQRALWRPLLPFSRAQLAAYAAVWDLPCVEDPSNHNTGLLRNWLRHQGLPSWRVKIPTMNAQIGAAIALLQDERALLEEVVADDWQALHLQGRFDVSCWRGLSAARQHQQLRQFACVHALGMPTRAGVAAFAHTLRQASVRTAQWSLPQGKAVLYGAALWPKQTQILRQWPWLAILPVASADAAALHLCWKTHAFGLPERDCDGVWRPVTKSDVLQLKTGRKNVKKMLQERHLPPFIRTIWPILVNADGRCLAVANVAVDAHLGVHGGLLPVVAGLPVCV